MFTISENIFLFFYGNVRQFVLQCGLHLVSIVSDCDLKLFVSLERLSVALRMHIVYNIAFISFSMGSLSRETETLTKHFFCKNRVYGTGDNICGALTDCVAFSVRNEQASRAFQSVGKRSIYLLDAGSFKRVIYKRSTTDNGGYSYCYNGNSHRFFCYCSAVVSDARARINPTIG